MYRRTYKNWFAALTDKQLRRKRFRSARQLEEAIRDFSNPPTPNPSPSYGPKALTTSSIPSPAFADVTNDSGH
jgi:hypothetical protein